MCRDRDPEPDTDVVPEGTWPWPPEAIDLTAVYPGAVTDLLGLDT